MATNIGPKIGIDGEAEYRKQINNIIQQAKTLDSEMRAVTSSFTKSTSAEEKSAATSKILAQQIEVQKQRVQELSSMLEKSAQKYGENDTRTLKWKEAVNKATAELNKMENELSDAADSTDDLGDAMEDAGDSALTFGDVLKANVLSQAIVDGVKRLASAVKDIAVEFIDSAASIKAEWSQFSQTFGEFEDEASAAIGKVAKSSGILDTRLNTLGAQIYAFAKSSGGDAAESMALMETALQATADSAAYYDRSLEDTAESLQSFLKGNYANDAALGLSATETTRNAAAMDLFGKKFNDLSEIQKQQTLLQMVVDSQKLSGAMGQAAREADGWENVQGNLNEAWRQFQAKVGAPFLEQLVPVIQQITDSFLEWQESFDWDGFGQAISDFVSILIENGPLIVSIVSGIAAGFVAWNVASMIQGVVSAIKGIATANEAAAASQGVLNAVMNANPFVLIITLLSGLIVAIITLWNTNEDFRNSVIEIWTNIKETVSDVVQSIVSFFTVTLPGAFHQLGEKASSIVKNIKQTFINMKDSIAKTVINIKDTIVNGIGKAIEWITELPGKAVGWGRDMIQGFIDGIKSMISKIGDAISGVANKIASFLHFSRPDIGPLRNYETWMPDMIKGMAAGIKENAHLLGDAATVAAENIAYPMASNSTIDYGGINIKIYGAEGQDVNTLADIVMRRMESAVGRKEAVW